MVAALVSMEYAFVPQHLKRLVQRKERLLLSNPWMGLEMRGKKKERKKRGMLEDPHLPFTVDMDMKYLHSLTRAPLPLSDIFMMLLWLS